MLLDIEKISYVTSNRTAQNAFTQLFTKNLISITNNDITEIKAIYKEIMDLNWKSQNWCSALLVENHKKLSETVNKLYLKISSLVDYDFECVYLTDKLTVCMSFCEFLQSKKAG